jgi:hypothetical protein
MIWWLWVWLAAMISEHELAIYPSLLSLPTIMKNKKLAAQYHIHSI